MITFTIRGIVLDAKSRFGLPGLFVKAYDKDVLFDDLLGAATTDGGGRFEIICDADDFREFFEIRPDLYFKVYRSDRRTLLFDTKDAVHWNAGRLSTVEIQVPGECFDNAGGFSFVLSGEDEQSRDELNIGEPMTLAARGLRPRTTYDIEVLADARKLFMLRLLTNAHGVLEPSVLWPQLGLDDPASDYRFTIDEALAHWRGMALRVRLARGGKVLGEGRVRLSDGISRPLILATDADGRLRNGFETGTQPLFVTVRGLPVAGDARLLAVPRQHDWRTGDALSPARLRDGRFMAIEFVTPELGRESTVELAGADALLPGAYQLIVRPLRYGYEENDAPRLLARDVVSSRRLASVVIREKFWSAKPVLGGCVNKIPVSGRSVSGPPYFRYGDTFAVGEDVWAALDPGIIDPGNVSKMCALYVVQNKSAAQSNASNALAHLVGGNNAAQQLKLQAGCINANKRLVWPAAPTEGQYDLVADFGNNTPDASTFTPDHQYNTPLDVIDGYFNVGFRVVRDSGTMSDYTHIGAWSYDETTVGSLGLSGTVTVQDEAGFYSSPGAITTTNVSVALRAHVRFPADTSGATTPGQISTALASFPVVVIVHGNGHSYTSYDFLLDHLAHNGFIAASIHLSTGMAALGRANVFFEHIAVLQAAFGTKLQNTIGVMGHSRGGEAVLKIARLNQQLSMGLGIQALMSLAPTDHYGREVLAGAWALPYFVLYGSADGDVAGWAPSRYGTNLGFTWRMTGFSLFDRAAGIKKSMAFVYGATHNGFITSNEATPSIPETSQRAIILAYANAFFRQHLRNELQWAGIFTGEWRPPTVSQTGARLFVQYQDPSRLAVDNFEGGVTNWQQSTIGGTVSHSGTLAVDPSEGRLNNDPNAAGLDTKSPHDAKGLLVRWDNAGDRLDFDTPSVLDVTPFTCVSLRVTQKADSTENPANQSQNFRLVLRSGNGKERAIRLSAFGEIPYPDVRPNADHTKSALTTIRIPLTAYTIVCAGMDPVQLSNVTRVSLLFSETPKGEIEIDDLEFSN
jgi:hypothetical protein